jgi:hypothetical protein
MESSDVRAGALPGVAAIAAILLAVAAAAWSGFLGSPTDAYVYLAAGERLNAGHALYALEPGDRIIGLNPPYWSVPFLSPPLLGVLWRPLALAGVPGMLVGWMLAAVAMLAVIGIVTRRHPGAGLAAVVVLFVPIGIQLGLGNVNAFIALGLVVAWLGRDRPAIVGSAIALMAGVKILPIVLAVWLAATGRWRGLAWFVGASGVLVVVSLVGAGLDAHVDYLGVMFTTAAVGSSELSVAGIARGVGVPADLARWAPWAVLGVGIVGIAALRLRDGLSFATAGVLLILASPVIHGYWLAMLVGVLISLGSWTSRPAALDPPRRGGTSPDPS